MKIRSLLSLGVLCFVTVAGAQDGSQKISFSRAAGWTRGILADLSKAAKRELVAAPSVAYDTLYLNVRDVTVDEAMKRIAAALHAEWRKQDDKYILDRSKLAVIADEHDEASRGADGLKKGIDQAVARSAKFPPFTEEAARRMVKTYIDAQADYFGTGTGDAKTASSKLEGLGPELPGGRALVQILALMSHQQLERIFGATRAVFSTRPTRMQLPMPNGAETVIRQLVKDMQIMDRAAKDAEGARDRSRVFATGAVSPIELDEGDVNQPGVAILRSGGSFGSSMYFQLTVADVNGETIATGVTNIVVPGTATQSDLVPGTNEKPIVLSENAAQYARVLRSSSGGLSTSMMGAAPGQPELVVVTRPDGSPTQPGADLFEQIVNPDKFEPMRLAPTEGLNAVADQLEKNVVAYLPDPALLPIDNALLNDKTRPTDFLNQLQSNCGVNFKSDGIWLELTPASPASARRQQVNRSALAKALGTLVKHGYLNLDDLSAYAALQETAPGFTRWDRACFMVVNASSADEYFGYQNPWWLLRLYGTLSPGQKRSLMAGDPLPIANLNATQLDLLGVEVFRSGYGVKVERPTQQKPGARVNYPGVLEEVTCVLPKGMTREGFIQVATTNDPGVQTLSSQTGAASFLTFGGLAWSHMNQDRPDLTSAYGAGARADKYRMAIKANHEFKFQFAPRVSMTAKLSDIVPDEKAQFVPYEGLPADFRNMVDSAASRLKDLATDMASRRSGGAKPPAPT